MNGYLIGINGGGTKTVCSLATIKGEVLSSAVAGPSNYHKVGLNTARYSIRTAIKQATKASRLKNVAFEAVCAGLAGVDRPNDRAAMRKLFRSLLRTKLLIIESDAYISLVGATEGRPGIIVIAGTGSVSMGVNAYGQRGRAGGWGHILGDEGSGYDIGRKALIAALKAHDGRGAKTTLEEKILTALKLRRLEQLVALVYNQKMPPDQFAALYPKVCEAAEEGDLIAVELLREAGRDLGATANAVIKKLGMQKTKFPVALSGGIFTSRSVLFSTFVRVVKSFAEKVDITEPIHSPEVGALLIAKHKLEAYRRA